MTITPDGKKLVAVGMDHSSSVDVPPLISLGSAKGGHKMMVFDIETRQPLL